MPLDGSTHRIQSGSGKIRFTRPAKELSLDYETYGDVQLVGPKSVGVWNYSRDLSTEALMAAYRIGGAEGDWKHVDLTEDRIPAELYDALCDKDFEKWSFNAAFERLITLNTLGIPTPYEGWRCTMALASMMSFTGDLLQVGTAMGIPASELKSKEGSRLIALFCGPQRITKKNLVLRRTRETDPEDWQRFCDYNLQDIVAETGIRDKLSKYYVPPFEWSMYEIDQRINDNGLPVNREFVQQAEILTSIRKRELTRDMIGITGLANPNSGQKLLPWLQARGYPFADLQKATVAKVLKEDKVERFMAPEARRALRLRRYSSQTSVSKYPAILRRLSVDDRLRHAFQFGGAARTLRWAGRGPQPHNLTKTPKILEGFEGDWSKLTMAAEIIESGNYADLSLFMSEPIIALAGSVRSSFQAPDGQILTVCDLSAIESAVLAWLSGCKRLLKVFHDGRDPYRDFGVELFKKYYADITREERTICKPAVLGCGYSLGGGTTKEGKRTGLYGYAEGMGVELTEEEADEHVKLFRHIYKEIPEFWKAVDKAAKAAIRGTPTAVGGLLRFFMQKPFLVVELPSGRRMYYHRPKITVKTFKGKDGKPFTRQVISYMGKNQFTTKWGRIYSSPGRQTENYTQAIARDILAVGIYRAFHAGFHIVGHVHDEAVTLTKIGDNRLTLGLLREEMIRLEPWMAGLPLNAAGYQARLYHKE